MEPKRGQKFFHARVLDENKNPMEYVVTRIAQGVVYYKPVDGGHSEYCLIEYFPRVVFHS